MAEGRSSRGRPGRSRLRRGVTQRPRTGRRGQGRDTGRGLRRRGPGEGTARKAASARGGRRGAPEAQAGRGRRRGTRGLGLRTPPPPSTTKPSHRLHPLPRTRLVPARRTFHGPQGYSTAGPGGRSPVRTNFPAAAPHLWERSTPSAASWPAAPGPRAPGDRAPVAAVVADPVGSGEPGEAVAALVAAAAPSSRGAHAAVPTHRPERDIRYIVGIPRASRDPSSRVTPGRIPARAGRPRPRSPVARPLRPAGRFLRCPARPLPPALRAVRLGSRRFSQAPRTSRLKKKKVHGLRCRPRKVEPALETGAPNKKPGRLTIRA